MEIRKATLADMNILLNLYENARQFMISHGNPTQWGTSYPSKTLLTQDIEGGNSYICEEQNEIAAAFFYKEGPDEVYAEIHSGQWLNDLPYGVVHRITSAGAVRGAASFCLDWSLKQCRNLRIDTHRDNVVMQHLLDKNGFKYCGIVYMHDGSERMAYQKVLQPICSPAFPSKFSPR
ncbi:MAG: GNAT family N-acetyltransferase [Muricomes sp.]